MAKPSKQPDWQIYERMIARLAADQLDASFCVTPNARIRGRISGRSRQVDALIDVRHDNDNTRRVVIEAKRTSRKIGVKDVEAFRGFIEDVGAAHGYLVCPVGHTKSAERRAQTSIAIHLIPLDRLKDFNPATWPKCRRHGCKNGRVFWDGYPELSLTVRPHSNSVDSDATRMSFVHYVGKCDRCGGFHILCKACDDLLSVPDDNPDDVGHQCRCRLPWFWIASIERDERGYESAELHSVFGDNVVTVDRRPR